MFVFMLHLPPRKFLAHEIMQRFDRYLILADTDFTDEDNFTVSFEIKILNIDSKYFPFIAEPMQCLSYKSECSGK